MRATVLLVALASSTVACSHTSEKPASPPSESGEAPGTAETPTKPQQTGARSKFIGTWHEEFESAEAQVRYVGDTTYRADGTFHVDGKMNYQGQDMAAVGSGTYRVSGGEVCYTFTEGSGPMEENLGQEICEELIEVSDTKIRYKSHNDGRVTELTRVSR